MARIIPSKYNEYLFAEISGLEQVLLYDSDEQDLRDFVNTILPGGGEEIRNKVLKVFNDEKCYELLAFAIEQNAKKEKRPLRKGSNEPEEIHYLDVSLILKKNKAPSCALRVAKVHDGIESFVNNPDDVPKILPKIDFLLDDPAEIIHLHMLTNYCSIIIKYAAKRVHGQVNCSQYEFERNIDALCMNAPEPIHKYAVDVRDMYNLLKSRQVPNVIQTLAKQKQEFSDLIGYLDSQAYHSYLDNIYSKTKELLEHGDENALCGIYVKLADAIHNATTSENLKGYKKRRIFNKSKAIVLTANEIQEEYKLHNNNKEDPLLDVLTNQLIYFAGKECSTYIRELEKTMGEHKQTIELLEQKIKECGQTEELLAAKDQEYKITKEMYKDINGAKKFLSEFYKDYLKAVHVESGVSVADSESQKNKEYALQLSKQNKRHMRSDDSSSF